MCGCRTPSDFICDLPMEINFAFYPPPTVNLPNLEIPDLKEYKYKFDRERLTIEKYEQEQQFHLEVASHTITSKSEKESSCEVLNSKIDQITHQNIQDINSIPSRSLVKNSFSSSSSPSFFNLENNQKIERRVETNILLPLKIQSNEEQQQSVLLQPQRPNDENPVLNKDLTKNNKNQIMDCLEEFEVRRPDLFDMVELKSIDDRLELAKLMLTANNQQSPTWYIFICKTIFGRLKTNLI
uniref:Uncharacterized protein n=1 Tax=Meloidogyne enterolobii TaxID=390850 RepID=A0A6V7WAW5_MELEN|nr:unnamed protein product [Meloidogyne enterolobii]